MQRIERPDVQSGTKHVQAAFQHHGTVDALYWRSMHRVLMLKTPTLLALAAYICSQTGVIGRFQVESMQESIVLHSPLQQSSVTFEADLGTLFVVVGSSCSFVLR